MLKKISLTVNGKSHELEINAGETLLEVLRERLHLTGAKEGCGVGECGACTVMVEGVPLNACLYLGVWADDKTITTVEGLAAGGELSKVQQAFVSEGAVQCGFCTPGFVITASAMAAGGRSYTRAEIKQELAGHLCRCTGYQKIIDAVEIALKEEQD
jgi:aerobic-type carbon monoxide dehydrogenase small subunit (CoxS/CutS family)